MAGLGFQLILASQSGDAAGVRACLAAGADANFQDGSAWAALHDAALVGHSECVAALVAAGGNANVRASGGCSPLHFAATQRNAGCVQLLLAAGADPLAATARDGWTPLHYAALPGIPTVYPARHSQVVPLLLQAGPAAALIRDANHNTPLTLAIRHAKHATARCLLEQGPLPTAGEVLAALAGSGPWAPLYATLVRRQPLTAEEWGMVPTPCHGLNASLPAVLGRSAEEAALLVQHLPAADRERLRTAALCLARAQRLLGSLLPSPIVGHILAFAAAPSLPPAAAPDLGKRLFRCICM